MSFLKRLLGAGSKPAILGTVASGNERELRELLGKGGDPNETDANGVPALALAAMRGDAACAKVLIQSGATIDVTDTNGWTPLMHAVMQGKKLPCVKVLLDGGANLAIKLKSGIGIDTLANNSTPEIRSAIRSAFDNITAEALNKTMRLSGRITLFLGFELTSLNIELAENGSSRASIGIPGTRITGLIGKALKIDYADATATVSRKEIDIIANCCSQIEKRFVAMIMSGDWNPLNETFRLTKLVPLVVKGMEPWTEAHLTYREMTISWALG
jgi:hypothetical protein